METLIRKSELAPSRTRLSEAARRRDAPIERDPAAARSVLDIAREEIEQQLRAELTAKMQELFETERARARAEGLEAALADARVAAEEELADARVQLTLHAERTLHSLEKAHDSAVAKFESSVGEVAFAALCRMLGQGVASQAFVLEQVARTCEQMRGEVTATARLHPRDIETLGEMLQGQELRLPPLSLKVVPDESLELGGCVIEAASGRFDGSLEGQLRRLHAALTQAKG
jgi:flagellar assembly protein FliH